jgi:hypothetical protein
VPNSKLTQLAVQGGKDAKLRLLNLANLSGQGMPGKTNGEVQVMGLPQGGEILTQPAVWSNPADGAVWVFIANGHGISGLKLAVDAAGNPSMAAPAAGPNASWSKNTAGTSPVLANGVLYYLAGAKVNALNPTTGAVLWTSSSVGGSHWQSPIVINARIYVLGSNSTLSLFKLP